MPTQRLIWVVICHKIDFYVWGSGRGDSEIKRLVNFTEIYLLYFSALFTFAWKQCGLQETCWIGSDD